MNQADIVAEMQVMPEIDVKYEIRRRVDFIKYQLELSGQKALVLGISGGVDSCTCGRLAQIAVDELNQDDDGYRFVAVRLPYAAQADETDAQQALDFILPSHSVTVNVQPGTDAIHESTLAALAEQGLADLRGLAPKDRAQEIINKCAHPDYKPLLQEYFDMASKICLAKGIGHEPQLFDRCFKMQMNLAEKGTMKIDSWD